MYCFVIRNSSKGVLVEFTLESVGYSKKSHVEEILDGKISLGSLGPYLVEPDDEKDAFSRTGMSPNVWN